MEPKEIMQRLNALRLHDSPLEIHCKVEVLHGIHEQEFLTHEGEFVFYRDAGEGYCYVINDKGNFNLSPGGKQPWSSQDGTLTLPDESFRELAIVRLSRIRYFRPC